MTRNRIIILAVLVLLPPAALVSVGFYYLWQTHSFAWFWWPMAICFATAYILAWRWQKGMRRQVAEEPPPLHYTDRDRLAWKKVEERIRAIDSISADDLGTMHMYVDVAQAMAVELAAVYHPEASDPIGKLTIPEMLSVVELAAHDLGEMASTYLPGGHLLTIDHLRQARQAVKWYKRANNTFWAISAAFDPIRTGLRYAASRAGLGKPLGLFQQNVYLWLYATFLRRLGHYFIELYSGRLKVGVKRYRELMAEHAEIDPARDGAVVVDGERAGTTDGRVVTIVVIGQVKAGKSSLINALLGERRAVTDVIPATNGIGRYELQAPGSPAKLVLLDTVGYNQSGPRADQFETTVEAAQQADLIFLVVHAKNPGRDADVKLWNDMKEWFAERPHLKLPPVVLIVTHIDLLSPAMEWSPPYDWRKPERPKEKTIAQAVGVVREQFGEGVAAIVPVCSAESKLSGIQEELIPEMTELLGQARAVSLLRCLHAEADERKVQRVFEQLYAAGRALLFNALGR
jgi:predicted GTPase